MDNYKVVRRLGRGAQGQVYLVQDLRVGKEYVLKQIECADERTAEKAFDEAKALNQLQHKYICGYQEFFVMWNQGQQSMNVCIAMDFYQMGDLDGLMLKKRALQEYLDEVMIMKWTGQMIDAMIFVHEMRIIHRDLKPSNIFLSDNLDVKIGDFGVSTVMGDERTKTRTLVGSMAWMAPEVLDRPYDERSDVWSLACIIVELFTCGLLTVAQARDALMEVKQVPQRLDEIAEDLKQVYSPELGHLLRTMLRRNFRQRPTMRELVEIEYCRQCLLLIKSGYVAKYTKDNQQVYPVDSSAAVPQTISHMVTHANSQGTMINCLEHLCSLPTVQAQQISDLEKFVITATMTKFMDNEKVQILCIQYLISILDSARQSCGEFFSSVETIRAICLSMKTYGSSEKIQTLATELLMLLSTDEHASVVIGSNGGVQDILSALRIFPQNHHIATNCCTAIWSLCASEELSAIVTEERGVLDVRNAMDVFKENIETVEAACSAIYSLSLDEDNITMMVESEVVDSIMNSLAYHMKDVQIPRVAALALSSIVEVDGTCLEHVLAFNDDVSGKAGVELIAEALKLHMQNSEAVGNIVALIMDMSDDQTAAEVILETTIPDLLKEVGKIYAKSVEIFNNSQIAYGRLQECSPESGDVPQMHFKQKLAVVKQDSVTRDKATYKSRSTPGTISKSVTSMDCD